MPHGRWRPRRTNLCISPDRCALRGALVLCQGKDLGILHLWSLDRWQHFHNDGMEPRDALLAEYSGIHQATVMQKRMAPDDQFWLLHDRFGRLAVDTARGQSCSMRSDP